MRWKPTLASVAIGALLGCAVLVLTARQDLGIATAIGAWAGRFL
jgi:hypothetical protein